MMVNHSVSDFSATLDELPLIPSESAFNSQNYDCLSSIKKAAIPALRLLIMSVLLIAGGLVFSYHNSYGSENSRLPAVLELPWWDRCRSISPKIVIEECSAALAKNEKRTDSTLADIYLSRADAYACLKQWKMAREDYQQ